MLKIDPGRHSSPLKRVQRNVNELDDSISAGDNDIMLLVDLCSGPRPAGRKPFAGSPG